MSQESVKTIFECDCTEHGLVLEEEDWDCEGETAYPPVLAITMWKRIPNRGWGTLPLWARIKDAWHVLYKGAPYTEFVMLQEEAALALSAKIQSIFRKPDGSTSPSGV